MVVNCKTKGNSSDGKSTSRVRSHKPPAMCDFPECGKTLSRQADVKRHKKIHSPELEHECPFEGCNHATRQYSNLASHIANIHKKDAPSKPTFVVDKNQKKVFASKPTSKSAEKPASKAISKPVTRPSQRIASAPVAKNLPSPTLAAVAPVTQNHVSDRRVRSVIKVTPSLSSGTDSTPASTPVSTSPSHASAAAQYPVQCIPYVSKNYSQAHEAHSTVIQAQALTFRSGNQYELDPYVVECYFSSPEEYQAWLAQYNSTVSITTAFAPAFDVFEVTQQASSATQWQTSIPMAQINGGYVNKSGVDASSSFDFAHNMVPGYNTTGNINIQVVDQSMASDPSLNVQHQQYQQVPESSVPSSDFTMLPADNTTHCATDSTSTAYQAPANDVIPADLNGYPVITEGMLAAIQALPDFSNESTFDATYVQAAAPMEFYDVNQVQVAAHAQDAAVYAIYDLNQVQVDGHTQAASVYTNYNDVNQGQFDVARNNLVQAGFVSQNDYNISQDQLQNNVPQVSSVPPSYYDAIQGQLRNNFTQADHTLLRYIDNSQIQIDLSQMASGPMNYEFNQGDVQNNFPQIAATPTDVYGANQVQDFTFTQVDLDTLNYYTVNQGQVQNDFSRSVSTPLDNYGVNQVQNNFIPAVAAPENYYNGTQAQGQFAHGAPMAVSNFC